MNKVLKTIGNIYISLMLVVYPLILTNKYFNVTDTKLYVFYFATAAMVISAGGILYVGWLRGHLNRTSVKVPAWFATALAGTVISVILTFIISPDKFDALNGQVEYGLGLAYIILLVLGVLILSLIGFDKNAFVLAIIAGSSISGIFAIIQCIGVDLFRLLGSITVEDKNVFLSTLGNTSFFGFFMVVAFPIAVYAYFEMDDSYRYLATVCVVVSSIGVVLSNTDATIMAYIVELLLIVNLVCKRSEISKFNLFRRLVTIVSVAMMLLYLFNAIAGLQRKLGGVQIIFINPVVWLIILILINLLWLLSNRNNNLLNQFMIGLRGVSWIALAVIMVSPIVAIIYTSHTYINLDSPISRLFYLDVNWGNQRGFIWSSTVDLFKQGTVLEKLFGRGIGTFSELFQKTYEVQLREVYNNFYDDAHNMFLQCLVEYGFIGLLTVIYFLYRVIKYHFKTEDIFNSYQGIALIGAVISMTCLIMQNITPALLIPFLAVTGRTAD